MNQLYTINYEYMTGDNKAFALRLCGDLIGYYNNYNQAYSVAIVRPVMKPHNYYSVVSLYMDVLWIRKGNINRIIYGADITETKNIEEAALSFSGCVSHSIECNKG